MLEAFVGLLSLAGLFSLVGLVLWLQRHARRLDDLERALRERPAAGPSTSPAAASPIPPSPPVAPLPGPRPTPLPAVAPAAARRGELEQLVGGVWLQHAGAGLVLLGVLLFLVWGYASKSLPPLFLVLAGVVLGAAFFWRGDRIARAMPAFGHVLIGVGIGVAYISVYLGHFLLRALSAPVAFPLLAATSFAAVLAGRRYRVQTIAAIGVAGAYLPELIGVWTPLHGFRLSPAGLLGHLAIVNGFVFALAAGSGWTRVSLLSLLLAAVTWIVNLPQGRYDWPVEIGFAALLTALGLSGLPRLARAEARVHRSDLAVAALAPLALLLCSLPFFARVSEESAGALLLSLAAVYVFAAVWVGRRRGEEDLWRPLTAAATVFLAGALERFLGEGARIAWAAEAFVLIAMGVGADSRWLRACGYLAGVVTWCWSAGAEVLTPSHPAQLAEGYATQWRTLLCVALGLRAARLLADERTRLAPVERSASEVTTAAAHALLLLWSQQMAALIVAQIGGVESDWRPPIVLAATCFAWAVQSAVLLFAGRLPDRVFLRVLGYAVGGLAFLLTLQALMVVPPLALYEGSRYGAVSVLTAAAIAISGGLAAWLAHRRGSLSASERSAPEVVTLAAHLALLSWSSLQARSIADVLGATYRGPSAPDAGAFAPGPLGPFLTSLAWLAQALAVFTVGWLRASAFLRWLGMALIGSTVLKFLIFDLRGESPFWRFLVAILAGVLVLGISYVYQRRAPDRSREE